MGNISTPLNATLGTTDLTADAIHVYFNFSATNGGYFAFQTLPFYSGDNYWCNTSFGNNFDCAQGIWIVPERFTDPSAIISGAEGNRILATAQPTTPASAPSTPFLMLLAIAAIAGASMRSRRSRVPAR